MSQVKTEKPQSHGKALWLIPIFLAAVVLVGYMAFNSPGILPTTSPKPATVPAPPLQEQTPTTTQTTTSENVQQSTNPNEKLITIKVTKDGFDGKPDWRATIKKGDDVRITYQYADENGDEHQLFVSGYNVYTPRFSPQDTEVSVQFKATETGTFALFCLNQNCKAHDKLNGKITVTP